MRPAAWVGHWQDVESGVLDVLADLAPGSNRTPDDLEARVRAAGGFLRVRRIGGSDDGFTDAALVDVDVFAGSRQQAFVLARAVRERLTAHTPPQADGFLVDRVDVNLAPYEVPNDNPKLTRYLGSYRVTTRRL